MSNVIISEPFFQQVRDLILKSRYRALRDINHLQVVTNYEIGRMIVENEQSGKARAEYGKAVIKELSVRLNSEFGRGYSEDNLLNMRRFYLAYRHPAVKSETVSRISSGDSFVPPFKLSWSHYLTLLQVRDEKERGFYEIESVSNDWSLRELKRQIGSSLYERLALSMDKDSVKKLSQHGHVISTPDDAVKDPYVLEFLGLKEEAAYSESDLETAIIDKLEHFLLELGKGYLFEARQKRFTFDEEHFYVDLVFYNRLLRCYVLIDLKLNNLSHQDLGQMQMYVNYFDRHVKLPDENPTIGILLCKSKKDAIVELTLPPNANIFASQYQLYLPSKEELRHQIEAAEIRG